MLIGVDLLRAASLIIDPQDDAVYYKGQTQAPGLDAQQHKTPQPENANRPVTEPKVIVTNRNDLVDKAKAGQVHLKTSVMMRPGQTQRVGVVTEKSLDRSVSLELKPHTKQEIKYGFKLSSAVLSENQRELEIVNVTPESILLTAGTAVAYAERRINVNSVYEHDNCNYKSEIDPYDKDTAKGHYESLLKPNDQDNRTCSEECFSLDLGPGELSIGSTLSDSQVKSLAHLLEQHTDRSIH